MLSFSRLSQRLQTWLDYFLPPPAWRLPVLATIGVLLGLLALAAHLANFTSYLSDDPAVCINCHIMNPQYATWQRGSHGRVAVCNDCHVPHDSLIKKYFSRARTAAVMPSCIPSGSSPR